MPNKITEVKEEPAVPSMAEALDRLDKDFLAIEEMTDVRRDQVLKRLTSGRAVSVRFAIYQGKLAAYVEFPSGGEAKVPLAEAFSAVMYALASDPE